MVLAGGGTDKEALQVRESWRTAKVVTVVRREEC